MNIVGLQPGRLVGDVEELLFLMTPPASNLETLLTLK